MMKTKAAAGKTVNISFKVSGPMAELLLALEEKFGGLTTPTQLARVAMDIGLLRIASGKGVDLSGYGFSVDQVKLAMDAMKASR